MEVILFSEGSIIYDSNNNWLPTGPLKIYQPGVIPISRLIIFTSGFLKKKLCFNDCPFDFGQSNCIYDVAVTSDINRRRMGRPVFMHVTFCLSRFEMELQLYNQQSSGSPSEVEEETVQISDDYAMLSQSLDDILADEGFAEMDSSKVFAAVKFVLWNLFFSMFGRMGRYKCVKILLA